MAAQREHSAGNLLRLEGELTIQQAARVRETLLVAIGAAESLSLDLAGVTATDIAGLQLLCAAHRGAMAAGKSLHRTGQPSAAFAKGMRESGYAREMECRLSTPEGGCLWVTGGDNE